MLSFLENCRKQFCFSPDVQAKSILIQFLLKKKKKIMDIKIENRKQIERIEYLF